MGLTFNGFEVWFEPPRMEKAFGNLKKVNLGHPKRKGTSKKEPKSFLNLPRIGYPNLPSVNKPLPKFLKGKPAKGLK